MPFDGTSKASAAAQSMIVLALLESVFEGGARWARRTFSAPDGKCCLLGAIDHVRCETGVPDDCAAEYLAGAINKRQSSKGLPPLGEDDARVVITGINRVQEDMGGWRVVRAMRRRCPRLAAVFMAALWPAQLRGLGCRERFLSKPVHIGKFVRSVKELLPA
jgi:hypothetical protein